MEIGVPSRFACLNIEDEDLSVQNAKPKESKKKTKKPPIAEPVKSNTKKSDKSTSNKKSESKQENKQVTVASKKNKKKQAQQWEEWKQKDDELENGLYEEDLRNAILLSKLDFEHNKEVYTKQPDDDAKQDKNKKAKKNKTISLDKFLNQDGDKQTNKISSSLKINCIDAKQVDFFNSIDSETKVELKKEQVSAKRKKREANINEVISLAQYQDKYEEEHRLRLAAEQEVKQLKMELAAADIKIKAFCKIVNQAQMKDKAGILLENQHLTAVKNDLTDSVANLHALLEKERSKVASLTAALNNSNKQKEKKRKGH